MKKILFVCLGNICRSSTAEGIMINLIKKEGLEKKITCESRGTISYHNGERPDSRSLEYAKSQGVDIPGVSQIITNTDIKNFDYIVAMDKNNYRDMATFDYEKNNDHKFFLICDFAKSHEHQEVPDPYYGDGNGFKIVFDLLQDACTGLLEKVKNDLSQ